SFKPMMFKIQPALSSVMLLYKQKAKNAPAPRRAPEAALNVPAALLEEVADALEVPDAAEALEPLVLVPLEPEADEPDEPDEPADCDVLTTTLVKAPPSTVVVFVPTDTVAVVLLPIGTVLKPDERPAGMVATAGWEVITEGCEVTTVGMPVTTPSELV
ncbi:hypothetical protein LTR28_009330, partial [Elasticomyces elasticus]